jgi:hypothetical protein
VPRLRFGVGRPADGVDPVDHVLSAFGADEERELPALVAAAGTAVAAALFEGVEKAMGHVNRVTSSPGEPGPGDLPRARPAPREADGESGDDSGGHSEDASGDGSGTGG